LFVDGAPVGAGNPLPVSGGGGSLGTVDQGTAGSAPTAWFTRDEAARTSLASIDGKLANPQPVSGPLTDAQLRASAVPVQLEGLQQNQTTLKSVGVDNFGNLGASIADPLTAFNELLVAEPLPRVQIDAAYGLLTTDIETRTALSGAATAANTPRHLGSTFRARRRARRSAADRLFDRNRRRIAQLARGIINVA
jgi:hypothetical protein